MGGDGAGRGAQRGAVGFEDEVEAATQDASEVRRAWTGRALGPVVAVTAHQLLGLAETLPPQGRVPAAIAALMAVWWMTEAMPLPVTSLLPVVLFPVFGAADIERATAHTRARSSSCSQAGSSSHKRFSAGTPTDGSPGTTCCWSVPVLAD